LESSSFWEFVLQNLAVILATLGLAVGLIKVLSHRKAHASGAHAQLTETEIKEAVAAGQRARDAVETRFGKHFG
jgi:hypothetical protein